MLYASGLVYTGGGGSKYKTIWSNPASYFGPLFETEFAGSTKSHTLAEIGKRVIPFLKGQNNEQFKWIKQCGKMIK